MWFSNICCNTVSLSASTNYGYVAALIFRSNSFRMKRGRTGLKPKLQTLPSQDERAMNHKWGVSRLSHAPGEDWGSLPHHVVLQIFQHLSLMDRARVSSVCRSWNDVFHTPDLWRRFEFELNQPATSYLRSTHPDLIQQIIKKHAQHLQYVSFKVTNLSPMFTSSTIFATHFPRSLHHLLLDES